MKVYIVDDDYYTATIISEILISAGIEADYSLNVDKDLVSNIEEFDPDVIILDIHLSENNDGVDLCISLKCSDKLKDKLYLAISSDINTLTKIRAYGVGFVDFVEKPFVSDNLVNRVKRYGILSSILKSCDELVTPNLSEIGT